MHRSVRGACARIRAGAVARAREGVTLVETLVAVAVLSLGIAALLGVFSAAAALTGASRDGLWSAHFCREQLAAMEQFVHATGRAPPDRGEAREQAAHAAFVVRWTTAPAGWDEAAPVEWVRICAGREGGGRTLEVDSCIRVPER